MAKTPKDQVWEYAEKADTAKLEQLLQTGRAVRGVTNFNLGEILEYMQQSHDQARAMVALAAIGYLQSGKSTNYLFGLHLGLLATLYLGAFQHDPKLGRECDKFYKLLAACVDDLDRLVVEFGKHFKGQFPEE